mmetsp:Transcript_21593/g.50388  ORF Transcript_21593/g.50388 Transcript_21593/m.50388 type:complete len:98 (-) Transcript_21593:591-884(-)
MACALGLLVWLLYAAAAPELQEEGVAGDGGKRQDPGGCQDCAEGLATGGVRVRPLPCEESLEACEPGPAPQTGYEEVPQLEPATDVPDTEGCQDEDK